MKQIILYVLLAFSLTASAQSLPDSIAAKPVTITLKMKHHAFIIAMMPDKGNADAIKYMNQVASYVTGTAVDTSVNVTVTVPYRLVTSMYLVIGSQQERLASVDNAEIKTSLIPQLPSDLLQSIISIAQLNAAQTEQIRNEGKKFILSIK